MRPTHLSVYLDQEAYAVPLTQVREIIAMSSPEKADAGLGGLRGMMELHGSLIPVVDLREPHGLPAPLNGRFMIAVIIELERLRAGLLVDGIGEVLSVPLRELQTPPEGFASAVAQQFLVGLWQNSGKTVALLDAERAVREALRGQRAGDDCDV